MDSELWLKIFEGNGTITSYILFVFLLSFIMFAKIETDKQNIQIKIAIIYILSYLLVFFNTADIKSILIILIISSFIFLEFVFIDNFKRKIMKKRLYFVLDYIYQIVFEYKIAYVLISFLLISSIWKVLIKTVLIKLHLFCYITEHIPIIKSCYLVFIPALSIMFLTKGIIKIINNEFETKSFEEIFSDMKKIRHFSNFEKNSVLKEYCKILTYKEDKSFFYREESYNWISFSFIKYRLARMYYGSKKYHLKGKTFIIKKFNKVITIIYYLAKINYVVIKCLKKLFSIIFNVLKKRKKITAYIRGYSTIEMQLIRTIAVKDGYATHIYQRKIYEIIYSTIFFNSLKDYYKYHEYSNLQEYKYYIIYLYIMIAPVKINGIMYENISKLYGKNKLNDITIEEFYIWTLGLSHGWIGPYLLESIYIESFGINRKKLADLIEKFDKKKENKL